MRGLSLVCVQLAFLGVGAPTGHKARTGLANPPVGSLLINMQMHAGATARSMPVSLAPAARQDSLSLREGEAETPIRAGVLLARRCSPALQH